MVENEIAELKAEYRKVKIPLREYQDKFVVQEKLTCTAQDETTPVKEELNSSCKNSEALSAGVNS